MENKINKKESIFIGNIMQMDKVNNPEILQIVFTEKDKKIIMKEFDNKCFNCKSHKENGQCIHIISLDNKGPRSYKEIEQYSRLSEDDAKKIFNHNTNGLWTCNDCNKNIHDNPDKYDTNKLLYFKYENKLHHSNNKFDAPENIRKKKLRNILMNINTNNSADRIGR